MGPFSCVFRLVRAARNEGGRITRKNVFDMLNTLFVNCHCFGHSLLPPFSSSGLGRGSMATEKTLSDFETLFPLRILVAEEPRGRKAGGMSVLQKLLTLVAVFSGGEDWEDGSDTGLSVSPDVVENVSSSSEYISDSFTFLTVDCCGRG